MTTRIFTTLGLLTFLAAGDAYAQEAHLVANVPFSFHAGNSVLPAGHYSVAANVKPGIVQFRCLDATASAMIITIPAFAHQRIGRSKLDFRRYGNTYFFDSVWIAGEAAGRVRPESKEERELLLSGWPVKTEELAAR